MSTFDERIAREREKLEHLKRQQRAHDTREKKRHEAISRDRQRIIGELVSKYFPEVLRFQPHRSNAENQIEFAPIEKFLITLTADTEYVSWLKERIEKQELPDGSQ